MGDQQAQHGAVASVSTAWRLIDGRVDLQHLAGVKAARAEARRRLRGMARDHEVSGARSSLARDGNRN